MIWDITTAARSFITIISILIKMNILPILESARTASRKLLEVPAETIDSLIVAIADEAEARSAEIIEANKRDLERFDSSNPLYDRLKLTPERIAAIAADLRHVASLPSPVNEVIESRTLPNGLELTKVSVPFGVIGVIYEARPNVSFDVASLCLKSGNACVLKGGSDAIESNKAIVGLIHDVMARFGIDTAAVTLLEGGHDVTAELLKARGYVDLVIPRGGRRLIDAVRDTARVPVIETGAGVCHIYVDNDASIDIAAPVVHNAKTRRVSVCNALDCLIVHASRLSDLPVICAPLAADGVLIYADSKAFDALRDSYPANLLRVADESSFGTEFLSLAMAVKTVESFDEAIEHINRYGSGHSEAIITENEEASRRFSTLVDAACVYTNAPTSWTDGAQFGLGAEIGISTQKLHARGPMALCEINTYKWIIRGNGQLRPR